MTKRERNSRPDRPSLERSLDALLDGSPRAGRDARAGRDPLPDDDLARWQAVAQVLTALTSAPESSELTGEARALAEFRARARQADPASRAYRPDPGWLTWLRGGRPAVAAATGALLLGGLLAVAYAGDLPAAAQQLAHDTIDAPAAGPPVTPGPHPVTSSRPAERPPSPAGQRSFPSSQQPDRREHHGVPSGSRHHQRRPGSAPGTEGGGSSASRSRGIPQHGLPAQSPSPGVSPTPGPTQRPSPSASTAPSAGATPSPPATPSHTHRSGRHRAAPSGHQSPPP